MKISVVTVCFNSEKTLERTLQSFLQQDYVQKELILIDGASTDGTQKIIEKYRSQIAIVVSEPDKGIYDAMNKGWQMATGEFVHFLNSDDWYVGPSVLSKLAAKMTDNNVIYHGRLLYQHVDGHTTPMGRPCGLQDLKYELKGIHQPATLFPRAAFDQWGGFDISYRISSDYELIRRFAKNLVTRFLDVDVVYMSDSGASARQISTALKENVRIAVHFGESPWAARRRSLWVHFWLRIRYSFPWLYRQLKTIKDTVQ
jgi:glycosyltransferase involved in cell wall biosynthesis